MNIGIIILISLALLVIVKLFFIHKKKENIWSKLNKGSIVHWLFVNPCTGTGCTHKGEVTKLENDRVEIDNLGWVTKKEFFNGKCEIEFLYI